MEKTNKRPGVIPGFKLLFCSLTAMSAFALNAQVEPAPSATTERAATESDDEVVKLESFSVTGSNIKRMDQEKVLPVTVFSYDQIQARDAVTPVDLLIGLPQITNVPTNETSTNAVAARGGNAAVALRGVGASNTLVLLNGRRLPYNPFTASTVNVNGLPSTGIQQVEVLRDGASAVYGSDAVAGVVNYITDTEPKGGSTSLRYGVTEHGGGMDIQGNFNYGFPFADGKGKWLFSATAYNRDAIYFGERELSKSSNRTSQARPPWDIVGSIYDGRSSISQYPSFRLGTNTITGTVNWFYPTGSTTPALTTTALPRAMYADYNPYTIAQPMTARANIYNKIEFELTPSVTVFGEAIAYIAKSQTGRQPITLNVSDARITLSQDNPYNPYGSRFYNAAGTPNADGSARITGTPTAITMNSLLMMDGGPEKVTAEDRMYRIMGGFRGKIGTSSWNWETAAMLGGYSVQDFSVNAIRESLLKQAALRTDATAWNPFSYTFKVDNGQVVADKTYTNPKSVRDFYTQSANRYGHSKLASWDARINGNVAELWAGPVAVSVGGEARWEFKEEHKDPYVSVNPPGSGLNLDDNDILVTSPKYDYEADRTVYSAYAETVIPLIAPKNNIPGAHSLEFNASARFESYSDFGETTKPKFGLNWKPLTWVMLRGSINKGFRAPDLASMYQPTSFAVATPPGNRDPVRNNYFIGANMAVDAQVLNKTYSLPNPTLGAEESSGKSAGIAVDVPGVRGLSVTIDYWEIEQKNLIISQTRETARDESLLRAYTQAQLAAGKNIMDIDTGSRLTPGGPNTYVGDIYTLRAAPTAEDYARFAASYGVLPQSQWIAPTGAWLGSTTQLINGTGQNFTNGIDYGIVYNLPRNQWGQFRLSTDWSQFIDKYTQQTPTAPIDDDIVAMLLPEWKSSTTVQWKNKGWGATLNATYQSDIRTNATTNATSYANAGSPSYIRIVANNGQVFYYEEGQDQLQLNLGLSYRFDKGANFWLRGTTFRLGINNILDEDPALVAASEAGTSTNLSGYSGGTGSSLWVGRAYSLTISRDF